MEPSALVKGLLAANVSNKEAELVKLSIELMYSFGSSLSIEDQEWLSSNLMTLPTYLGSKEGGKMITALLVAYKNHLALQNKKPT